MWVSNSISFVCLFIDFVHDGYQLMHHILMCVGCWVGLLMILLIYSHFNLYFLLGSFYIYLTGLIQGIIMTNKGYMAPIWNCRGLKYLNILVPLGLNSIFSHCFVVSILIINIATTWLFINKNNSTASSCELSTWTGFWSQNCFLSYHTFNLFQVTIWEMQSPITTDL